MGKTYPRAVSGGGECALKIQQEMYSGRKESASFGEAKVVALRDLARGLHALLQKDFYREVREEMPQKIAEKCEFGTLPKP